MVALHPEFEFSYAPGQIVKVSNDLSQVIIRFYDFVESIVKLNEVFKLHRLKYQVDIENIVNLEKKLIGKTVVARNDYSNVYELGMFFNK